jgi:hypothetical protein
MEPLLFSWDLQTLDRAKANPDEFSVALNALRSEAQKALGVPPQSVMDKMALPPSGDPHDYMSLGSYWWPNPDTADGLPYVRRDGERNPEGDALDARPKSAVCSAATTLSLAAYLFDDGACAEHAACLLRVWFLDEATRMNPHLEYGQMIPGICEGRDIGIIDTSTVFPVLVDAVSLLATSDAWTDADADGFGEWMDRYLTWLLESEKGRSESRQANNHGTYADTQLLALGLFTGRTDAVKSVAEAAAEKHISSQIEPDGAQPLELRRTRSRSYSLMNLNGLQNLAILAGRVGVDLWTYRSGDGRSLKAALDWFLPYVHEQKAWTWEQIAEFDPAGYVAPFRMGLVKYGDTAYREVLESIPSETVAAHRVNLTFPSAQDR